jgi:ABC-type transport system substrate-binding protein
MHRKILFLAAAAFALTAFVGSASAMTGGAYSVAPAATNAAGSHTPYAVMKHSKNLITVAQEQDLSPNCGWNINQANCTLAWAVWVGWNPILRGPLLLAYSKAGYKYKPDLTAMPSVDQTGITYHIRGNAKWNYGGKLTPVTGADFIYTVELLNNPNNQVASNTGVNQIGGVVYNPKKPTVVRFLWKQPGDKALGGDNSTIGCTGANACGPFADYRDLLGSIYPQAATQSLNFNTTMFKNCVCGANGKYITDGPYYMQSYIRGSSVTLKANKKTGAWYGLKPKIATVRFQIITNTTSELQAIKGLEVDAASPQPTPSVGDLVGVKGLTVKFVGGAYLEHVDFNEGNGNQILKDAFFRQAFMLSLDRQGIINAALPYTHGGLTPLNSLLVFQADSRYKAPFATWNFNQAQAISKLQGAGCTGGPSSPDPNNNSYFTCPDGPAQFTFTYASDNARRVASFQIMQADAKAVGIKLIADPEPTNVMFQNVFAGNYDATEFAWGGSIDPGGFIPIWHCNGDSNIGASCNHTADGYMDDSLSQLNPTTRDLDFVNADAALSNSVPAVPLYALPDVLAYNSLVGGMAANPAAGFTWNMESWYWKS